MWPAASAIRSIRQNGSVFTWVQVQNEPGVDSLAMPNRGHRGEVADLT